ncbi:MAG: D-alanyl-D-alanine carboxypeptidase [Lentisphaeria bacterium]|nr:D-alanyl-D-alanine carboxypeptidase [Lentisphaeria bacterium]
MKLRYVFLTIGLIVLAHLVILFVFFYQPESKPEQKETPASGESAGTGDVSAARQDQGPSALPADPVPGTATVKPVPVIQNKSYPAFNYRTAWKGNIPELPESAGARGGILVDADTGNVLWDKQAVVPVPIASMTKIMTLLLASEDIVSGRNGVSLESPVKISRATMKIGGSQVWLDVRETFKLEELLKAVAIKSANDAAYQVAEFLGNGDVYGFVVRMNQRARELGLKRTRFYNPHGLPGSSSAEDNVSSPEDMARLAEYCLNHPKIMEWAAMPRADFRGGKTELINHNNLLPGRKFPAPGVDGLKTGFINRSGYCVSITCKRAGRRMVAVVMGFDSARNRDLFARRLLDWGYARAADPAGANARSAKIKPKAPAPVRRPAPPAKKKPAPAKKSTPQKKR